MASQEDIAVLEAQIKGLEAGDDIFTDPAEIQTHVGSDETGAVMHQGKIKVTTNDYTLTMYRTDTGEPIPVKRSRAAWTMANKRLPDGRPAFSLHPTATYGIGEVPCFLHPDHPDHAKVLKAGIRRTCRKATLATDMDAMSHGQYHHKREWAIWQDYQARQERAEDRDRQERMLGAMLATRGGELPVMDDEPVATSNGAADVAVTYTANVCEACGWLNEKGTPQGMSMHKRRYCSAREV